MAPSFSLHTTVPCCRRLHSPGETLAFNGRRRASARKGRHGSWGHPNPAGPMDLLPRARLSGQRWGPERAQPPWGDSPQPRDAGPGAKKKTRATKQGG